MDRTKAISFMHNLLRLMVSKDGSDLFITAGSPPAMKVDGKITIVSEQILSPNHTQILARSIMNDKQLSEFESSQECNFAIGLPGVARFRVNAFVQRGSTGLVLRFINSEIPTFKELHLPDILQDIAMTKRGLVIFVGGTGSGKSTSLASMVNYRNKNSHGHIITIEDPVEFVHQHINCLVTQREVGVDTETYDIALKNVASGPRCYLNWRGSRPRNHGACDCIRRNRAPVSNYFARQQHQSGARSNYQLLP
jgi:twitching motility protein PilU